mmetsp:Transcript_15592/g.40325  ORF Transcript_15592/g.40325 Transcript_15592/m.40325 type:complete len:322 (+) Transcript_15592:1-966(+)
MGRTLACVPLLRAFVVGLWIAPAAPLALSPCRDTSPARQPRFSCSPQRVSPLSVHQRSPCPTCLVSRSSNRWRRPTDRELLDGALRPIRWLSSLLMRLIARIKRVLRGGMDDAELAALAGAPQVGSARALRLIDEVMGVATRKFPPTDEVLTYFNYKLSPFYSQLPDDYAKQAVAEAGEPVPAAGSSVRWLRYRLARPPSSYELAVDHSRVTLLRELYEEVQAEERSQKLSQQPQFLVWLTGGAAATPLRPKPDRESVLLPLDRELSEGTEAQAGDEILDEDAFVALLSEKTITTSDSSSRRRRYASALEEDAADVNDTRG